MTDGSRDTSFRADHEGTLLNAAAAQLVYESWRR
jgi:hypothetical protein